MNRLRAIEREGLKTNIPAFNPGDTVRVMVRVREGDKERLQAFEGVCIARRGAGINATFTVRKISARVGVERIFPLHASSIAEIELVRQGRVPRAKLYFLRRPGAEPPDGTRAVVARVDAGPRAGGRPALSRAGPRPRSDHRRRRPLPLDRRRVGHRENRARSPDGVVGGSPSLVRLGEQQGLCHPRPPRRARDVRLHVPSPQELRAGGAARAHGFARFSPFLNSAKGPVFRISPASSPARLARYTAYFMNGRFPGWWLSVESTNRA